MNRKEWRKQQALERRAQKAWEEADKDALEILELWLKKGEMSGEEFVQICDNLRSDFVEAINYRKVSVGLTRLVLITMMAESLVQTATDLDTLAEEAADFGQVLVRHTLKEFDLKAGTALNK